jgi:hypothetical protein
MAKRKNKIFVWISVSGGGVAVWSRPIPPKHFYDDEGFLEEIDRVTASALCHNLDEYEHEDGPVEVR